MGCDIHITAERKTNSGYEAITDIEFQVGTAPFDWRAYGMFCFLAGVRNYSDIKPISQPRGIPKDISNDVEEEFNSWSSDAHSGSWLSISELLEFGYDDKMEDLRVMENGNGGCTTNPGSGKITTYKEFLGSAFFKDLSKLEQCGAERIVFWFDN
jgi:hypothetical protein